MVDGHGKILLKEFFSSWTNIFFLVGINFISKNLIIAVEEAKNQTQVVAPPS